MNEEVIDIANSKTTQLKVEAEQPLVADSTYGADISVASLVFILK